MSFGEKLFQLRSERGIYQKEIAEFLGVSVGTISNYENGVHSPDLATLCKLAGYFNVTTDFMLELTENATSMEKLNVQMSEEHTIGSALNAMQNLSQPGRRQMLKYLTMVKTCEDVPKKNRIISKQRQTIEQQNQEISRLKELLQIQSELSDQDVLALEEQLPEEAAEAASV